MIDSSKVEFGIRSRLPGRVVDFPIMIASRSGGKHEERVDRIPPGNPLASEALTLARQPAAGPRIDFRYREKDLNRALVEYLRSSLDVEADRMVRGAFTEEFQQAVQAFQEKRTPRFLGR